MRDSRIRLGICVAVGVVAAALAFIWQVDEPDGPVWLVPALIGYLAAGLCFIVPVMFTHMRWDGEYTKERMAGEHPGAATSEVIVILAALTSIAAVVMLIASGKDSTDRQLFNGMLTIGVVAVGWVWVQTIYTLRYARLYYYDDSPDIDFDIKEPPPFSDFAYFSYNLGMTYQVSDTTTQSPRVRRIVLGQCLLSYLYGAVIIASAINLVVGLGTSGS